MLKVNRLFVVIVLLALVPLAANATMTRVIGLGGAGTNYVIKDAANPQIWPQLICDYPNLAGAEFQNALVGYDDQDNEVYRWDFYKAYVNYYFESCGSALQFTLDKYPGRRYYMSPSILDEVPGNYNRLNLTYGRPFGDLLAGLTLNYAGKSYKSKESSDGANDDVDASYATYGLVAGVTALEKKLDLALGFEAASFSQEGGNEDGLDNDGSMALGFVGRYWYTASDRYALIPNLKFSTMKDANKIDQENASSAESYTTTVFELGVANNWTPVENMLAVFELGVASTNLKSEYESTMGGETESEDYTDSEFDIYWRLGFETKVFDWLNGRIGAERVWSSASFESNALGYMYNLPGKEPEVGTSITETYLGATAHWNRMYLDLLVSPYFMENGPYFVSGSETNLFGRVSLKYDFNK